MGALARDLAPASYTTARDGTATIGRIHIKDLVSEVTQQLAHRQPRPKIG